MKRILLLSGKRPPLLLGDDFSFSLAAGSINGTLATDGVNTRTVLDTNSKLSIGSGTLNYATGEVGNGDPRLAYPSIARARGLTVIAALSITAGVSYAGWDGDTTTLLNFGGSLNGGGIQVIRNAGVNLTVGTNTLGSIHYLASICRTTGMLFMVKGGIYSNWTLMYVNPLLTTTPLYPTLHNGGTTHVGLAEFVRVPKAMIIFNPIASDSFNRADAALGTSDAAGSEETASTTPAWVDKSGTSAIVTNVAKFSALGGGVGISVLETNVADIFCEVVATRTAGNTGMCLRYTDASNYITCYHNGTNLLVVETVAGTPNTLINAVATYGATNIMTLSLNGSKVRAYYGAAAIGSEATTAITTGTKHGIYTTDTGATFNNFTAWAKGNNGEYGALNKYI